jgi:hypothetical protein
MDAQQQQLLAQMETQRKRWVPVAEGKRIQILLPTELAVLTHFVKPADTPGGKAEFSCDVAEVKQYACGWDGITEADLLGAAVGSQDAVAFAPALWAVLVEDRVEWIKPVARALLDGIVERQNQRATDAKNSAPSLTSPPAS